MNPSSIEAVSRLYEQGDFEGAVAEAKKISLEENDPAAPDLKRTVGLAQFQLKNFTESEKIFSDICNGGKPRADDWFNLCTSATMNHHMAQGSAAMAKALEMAGAAYEKITFIYYYACTLVDAGEYETAFAELKKLTSVYSGVTDYTHLMLSAGGQIPSFDAVMDCYRAIAPHIDKAEGEKFLGELYKSVDADGKAAIDAVRNDK